MPHWPTLRPRAGPSQHSGSLPHRGRSRRSCLPGGKGAVRRSEALSCPLAWKVIRRRDAAYPGGVTEAIFALVGVVVGGLITAGTTYWMERKREDRDVQAAARRVYPDLYACY